MAEGRRRQEWTRTAYAACAIANVWLPKGNSMKFQDFPYCHDKKQQAMATEQVFAAFAKSWGLKVEIKE